MRIKTRLKLPFIFWMIFCLWACKEAQDKRLENTSIASSVEILRQIEEFSHDDLLLKRGNKMRIVGQDSMLIFDESTRNFVLFDLIENEVLWNQTIVLDGPNFFEIPAWDFTIENETLYVLSQNYFSSYRTINGLALKRISSSDINGWNSSFRIRTFELDNKGSVYFPITSYAGSVPGLVGNKKQSIIYKISSKGQLDSLPINAPNETLIYNKDLGYYNNFANHYLKVIGDSIIFNYEFSSNIYIYSLSRNELITKEIEPKLSPTKREPIRASDARGNSYKGPKFFPLYKLEDDGIFVRYHTNWEKGTGGSQVKKQYLMVFDNEFNVLDEIDISEEILWDNPVVSGNKIYFHKLNQEFEDRFQYVVYTVESVKE